MKNKVKHLDPLILELYSLGKSSTVIGNILGISSLSIISRLRANNVIRHTRMKNMEVFGDSLKNRDLEIILLYNSGKSLLYIERTLGINRNSARYRLTINNVLLRNKKGIKHCFRSPTISLDFFREKVESNKSDFEYFLGIIATDGNVCNNLIRIGSIADENVLFLQQWCLFLDNKVTIKRHLRSDKLSYYNTVAFKNQDIVNYLKDFGIVPNKTFTLKLPYINWHILRGVFDGDGCLVKNKRYNSWKFEIVSASIDFASLLLKFLLENNIKVHLYKEGTLYRVVVGNKQDLQILFNNLYKNCSYFLLRKYDKFLPIIQETE